MPRGTRPKAARAFLYKVLQLGLPGGSEDSTLPPWAAKKGKVSKPDFFYSQSRRGRGRDAEENFLLKFLFRIEESVERTPRSAGLRGWGEGNPLDRLTAGRGRGAPEVEGAWDGETGLGAGSRSCRSS